MTNLRHDDWLSTCLGKPAYHLTGRPSDFRLDDLPSGPALVGAKVPVEDVVGLLHLQGLGFRVLDTNIQLRRPADVMPLIGQGVRFARPDDEEQVRTLARTCFAHNRFHRDPEIPDALASLVKEEWAGNYFSGKRGQWMVVAEDDGHAVGFLQLLGGKDEQIVIDLIAVAQASRGKGLAREMIAFASKACLGRTAAIQVGTQIANTPSLGLYTRLGFRIVSASYVLHLHLKGAAA